MDFSEITCPLVRPRKSDPVHVHGLVVCSHAYSKGQLLKLNSRFRASFFSVRLHTPQHPRYWEGVRTQKKR